jgi:hypothetical protein
MKVKSFVILKGVTVVVARQYIEISKKRLFDEVTLFTRVFEKTVNTIDISETRYIYLNLKDDIFLVLLCNVGYNIFTGLELLRNIYRIVMELNPGMDKSKHYDMILAIDDIVEGESVAYTLDSLKMHSVNEVERKRQNKEKEETAKTNMVKGIEEIERLKYTNQYIDTSVSEEKIREKEDVQRRGMELKQLFIEKLIEKEEERIISKKLF